MGDPGEEYRKSIKEFVNKAQRVHMMLIAFSVILFIFAFLENVQVQQAIIAVKKRCREYESLINLSQSVADQTRKSLLLNYSNVVPSEETRTFMLISDIQKARGLIKSVRKRMFETAMIARNILPAVDEKRISLVRLNPSLNVLEEILYFKKLALAEESTGTFSWQGSLEYQEIGSLARLGYAASANPRKIVESLSGYISDAAFEEQELSSLARILEVLVKNADGETATALRSAAEQLWKEWATFEDSSRLRASQVQSASINDLNQLHEQVQDEIDKLEDRAKGGKAFAFPGVPGEVPLALSIWCAPFVGSLAFALGTIFVMRARQIAENTRDKKIRLDFANLPVAYVLALTGKGSAIERMLLYLARFVTLFLPLSLIVGIGLFTPTLWPMYRREGVIYWLGSLLNLILTLLFARECSRFRKASEEV